MCPEQFAHQKPDQHILFKKFRWSTQINYRLYLAGAKMSKIQSYFDVKSKEILKKIPKNLFLQYLVEECKPVFGLVNA